METKPLYELYKAQVEAFNLPLDVFYTFQKDDRTSKPIVEKVFMNGYDLTTALSNKFYAQLEKLLNNDCGADCPKSSTL